MIYLNHNGWSFIALGIFYLNITKTHCLKITQNVVFDFRILAFSTNFCPIKTDMSGNTVWLQASGFQKLARMDKFWHF